MEIVIANLSRQQTANIYKEWINLHFPSDEVKPLKNIYKMWDEGAYSALALYDKEACEEGEPLKGLIGYAFFVNAPDSEMVLLDYYAIIGQYRNQGLGSVFLGEIKRNLKNSKGIIIETEDVELAVSDEELVVRKRRNMFYTSNGAVETGIKTRVYGVPYAIWSLAAEGVVISREESLEAVKKIYRTMFPPERFGTHIFISDNVGVEVK